MKMHRKRKKERKRKKKRKVGGLMSQPSTKLLGKAKHSEICQFTPPQSELNSLSNVSISVIYKVKNTHHAERERELLREELAKSWLPFELDRFQPCLLGPPYEYRKKLVRLERVHHHQSFSFWSFRLRHRPLGRASYHPEEDG
jgi:hypothetical protein